VEKMLGKYGKIVEPIRLVVKESYSNKDVGSAGSTRWGFAFGRFSAPAEALAAISGLDGRMLLGRHLTVRFATDNTSQSHATASSSLSTNGSSSANTYKERQRIDDRIAAVKRKLQEKHSER
jgi:RNA recognition motif-containing protein